MLAFGVGNGANGFAVRNFRLGKGYAYSVTRLQFFCEHFEMNFALSAEYEFARVRSFFYCEGIVFFAHLVKARKHLVFVALVHRFYRERKGGAGESYRVELNGSADCAKGVVGVRIRKFVYRAYVARRKLCDRFRLFAAKYENLTDTLFRLGVGVKYG